MARGASAAAQTVEVVEKRVAGMKRDRKRVEIDAALDDIHAARGRCLPADVLEVAADEAHPLHKYFEWDDGIAAQKYRMQQAHDIILGSKMAARLVEVAEQTVVIQAETTQVRRFVNAFPGEGYRVRNEVLSSVDERAALVEKKLSVLRGWCREAVDIEELAPLCAAIQKGLAAFEGK